MIELPVTLTSTGGAVSFASPVTLGYTKNKGVYRLLVTAEGEWDGLTIRCFWHLPGGTDPASSLVQDGFVDVPASVTAQPGTGCITFEGSNGEKTVTSTDLRYKVGSNSGTEDGTMPEPGTPAWEQLVSATKANADAAEQAKNDAQAAAKGVETAAAKAEEAAERSTRAGIAASNAADDAAGSAVAAGNAASAAAGSESAAAKSAQAAMESKTAAATSEGNAAASAKKAQDVADSLPVDYVTAVNEIAALKTNKADKTELGTVQKQIGNLDDLTTKAKETLVAAINEAARTGAAMRTDGGYIQYSTDDGNTWENLIALAELKGEPGQNGADGYSPTASVEQSTDGAKITITDKSGTTEAAVKNGKDGENGRDGADGQPGRDGVNGQPGKDGTDGITPTIGDNGNWFLGATDTGKPSRGATGDTGPQGPQGTDGKDAPQINDTAITTTNPWSSKHIIDMLCPPLEESGDPVVCYPVAGYPLGVKAKWEPVQEGSGTPSPENIRPIKGRDSVAVERCGENLLDEARFPIIKTQNNIKTTSEMTLPAGTYTVCVLSVANGVYALGADVEHTYNSNKHTFTLARQTAIKLDSYWLRGRPENDEKIWLVEGNEWRPYTPYTGQTNTLTLPTAIYGGEVDAVMGDGKRTWEIIDSYAGETIPREWISDRDVYSADKNPTVGAQVAYRLAEPVSFAAAGARPIPALSGTNTVLTDADNATVTGRADPIKRIADLEDKERKNDV